MLVAATAAALVGMVCRITAANPKFTSQREAAERIAAAADLLRAAFLDARQRDEDAFEAVVRAQRLPKCSDEEKAARASALERALHHAAAIPLEFAQHACRTLALTHSALAIENKNLISDLGCAAEFSHAALKACAYSVRINHKYMKDDAAVEAQGRELAHIEHEGEALTGRIRESVDRGLT